MTASALLFPFIGASPARATGVPSPMGVRVWSADDTHFVCAYGYASSGVNNWQLHITGARLYVSPPVAESSAGTAGSVGNVVIAKASSGSSRSFNVCVDIPHAGAYAGHFQATLAYAGVGVDVALVLVGRGTWAGAYSDSNGTGIGGEPM